MAHPIFYQGDEIGMTNVSHESISDYDDVETQNAWRAAEDKGKDMNKFMKAVHWQSRDNARTPMQWDDTEYAGFSSAKPWIPLNENYTSINVAAADVDQNSILNYYRRVIAYRKDNHTLIYGDFEDINPKHKQIFCYRRWDTDREFLIVHNFSDHVIDLSLIHI